MAADDLLIVADGAHCPDLRYAVGAALTRPAVYLRLKGAGYALLDEMDLTAAPTGPRGCRVRALNPRLSRTNGSPTRALATLLGRWLRARRVRRLLVPATFPLGLARELRRHKLRLRPCPETTLFPERAIKSPREVAMIRAAVVMAEVGLAEGLQTLKNAQITSRGWLLFRGAPLTAERLRAIMQVAVFQAGGHPEQVTVALGVVGAQPGPEAHGLLPAHRPILLAVAPCSNKTGYHAELVRTVVRGRARDAVRADHAALLQLHAQALRLLHDGASAAEVHARLLQALVNGGPAPSGRSRPNPNRQAGVEGHGVGLDRREAPWLPGEPETTLQTGQVLALTLALSRPRGSAVCLGDLMLIARHGARNLTQFEKVLEV